MICRLLAHPAVFRPASILLLLALIFLVTSSSAATLANPYQTIADQNAFRLKPIPAAPVPVPEPIPPPPPLATVKLTGFTTLLSNPKVLVEITEPGPGRLVIKPVLGVGDKIGTVQILAIEPSINRVRIRNGNVETNLTFETASSRSADVQPAAVSVAAARVLPRR